VAVQQVALISDESALEACACSRMCAIQIDDLYLFLPLTEHDAKNSTAFASMDSDNIAYKAKRLDRYIT